MRAQTHTQIQRAGPDSDFLPTAHTCFNTVLLPEYKDKAKLQALLNKAITECEGFGLK
jgi:ubiquitin-protein ligase E3 A